MAGPSHLFKFHAGDGGLRVPLVMSGPGLPEAARIPAFTTMADVTPTLLELAGAESDAPGTKPITGRSLLPLLNGEAGTVYGEDEAVGFSTSGQAALYRGRYKLVRNLPPHGDSVWRLFDMEDDPGETIDLSDEMPGLKADLMEAYRQYAERVGVLELPPGYQVEQQIAHNIREKLWEYYWHWFLLAGLTILIVLALLFIGARRLLRALRAA